MAELDIILLQKNGTGLFAERTISPGTDSVLSFGSAGAPEATPKANFVGATGPQGSQGSAGAQGSQGNDGGTGATGPQGDAGSQGSQGSSGASGPQGYQGAIGFVTAPTTATSTGTAGTVAYDTSYFYVCVATDTWHRAAIAIW